MTYDIANHVILDVSSGKPVKARTTDPLRVDEELVDATVAHFVRDFTRLLFSHSPQNVKDQLTFMGDAKVAYRILEACRTATLDAEGRAAPQSSLVLESGDYDWLKKRAEDHAVRIFGFQSVPFVEAVNAAKKVDPLPTTLNRLPSAKSKVGANGS